MVTASSLNLSPTQFNYAVGIVQGVKNHKMPVRAAHIAIATAITESALWMYANGNNPRSLQLPHDRVGWDHGSVGLFQQQVGGAVNSTANWGTTEELMDPATSCGKFLDALSRTNWTGSNISNWDTAQKVQGSFDPTGGNYKRNDNWAIQIGNALWGGAVVAPKPSSNPIPPKPVPGTAHYTVHAGDSMGSIASRYHMTLNALEALNPGAGHPAGNFNLIHPGDILTVRGVSSPPAGKKIWTVKPGDSISSIANAWGITVQALEHANPHDGHPAGNWNNIWPGDVLVHP